MMSGLDRIDYFNPELETHDCVSAHGLWVETFADTGNRMSFHNHAEFAALYPKHLPALNGFCAPRAEIGDSVLEPIRARLGCNGVACTTDPELRLIVGDRSVAPFSVNGETYRFRVAAAARWLMLTSRSDVPARSMPGSGDKRRLGVSVSRIKVIGDDVSLDIGMDWAGFGAGFHESEGRHRWSNGNGSLSPALLAPFDGEVVIEIDARPLERYRSGPSKPAHAVGG
jgi:hypothetical protein